MATRPKWTVPFISRSMHGLSKSPTPMLVPPVEMMTSASSLPRLSAALVASIVSPMIPRSTVSKWRWCRIDRSEGRFESGIAENDEVGFVRVSRISTSSFPVERTATIGRRCTAACMSRSACVRSSTKQAQGRTDLRPTNASVPSSPPTPEITSPCSKTFSPSATSLPAARTFSPASTCARTLTSFSSPAPPACRETISVSSTMMTASAPGGSGAPVLMR